MELIMRKQKVIKNNSIPFLLLAFVHIVLFLLFAYRSKQKNIWILLLSNIGLAYLFEYPVLNLFRGYSYRPNLIKIRAQDKVLGAILSQGFYVPITATLLTLYRKNAYWKLGSTLIYYLIEHFFLYLKIYKTYWWKPAFTLIFMNLYFYISDWFYKALTAQKKWALKIAHYLSIDVIGITLMYMAAVGRKIRFGRRLHHSWGEHFIFAPLYSLVLSFFAVKNSSQPGIFPKLSMLMCCIALDKGLERTGILKIKLRQLWGNIPFHAFMIFLSRYLHLKIYQKPQKPPA
jgi:hypothetical protein